MDRDLDLVPDGVCAALRHLAELRADLGHPLALDADAGRDVFAAALTDEVESLAVVAAVFVPWHGRIIDRIFYMRWYADCGDRERAGCWDTPASSRRPSSRSGANPLGEG